MLWRFVGAGRSCLYSAFLSLPALEFERPVRRHTQKPQRAVETDVLNVGIPHIVLSVHCVCAPFFRHHRLRLTLSLRTSAHTGVAIRSLCGSGREVARVYIYYNGGGRHHNSHPAEPLGLSIE